MLELTYSQVAAIVVVSAFVAGTLVAYAPGFLAWTDRVHARREEKRQAAARAEFLEQLAGTRGAGKVVTRRMVLHVSDPAPMTPENRRDALRALREGGLLPSDYAPGGIVPSPTDRTTQPEKEGTTDDQ